MKMNSKLLKEALITRLERPEWAVRHDREKDTLRFEHKETKKGITISLPGVMAKWHTKKEKAIEEVAYYVEEALVAMHSETTAEKTKIFPVIRSTSFPTESSDGKCLITAEHTAETRIYYAVDSGTTYRLIDEELLQTLGYDEQQVKEMALFNIRSLSTEVKQDEVAGNVFYFVRANDGYDASRILDESLLHSFKEKAVGEMVVAVPHQDVLIIGDIRNETGYDVLAQITMKFFMEGRVPITSLSFVYESNELEPIFILGKKRIKE
ncbi:DUF1444 domain-containing protein [Bacillus sp. 165]|uniref:DUF1444 domain-containing protein n=1 Tax=Bacillus sp. 165 TaxID=1529117 RepID=UPI001ADA60CD|nr:DUF1444 domain-containing protein [Bacillus sp. 165]MBO9131232.1 DUF1444 domain-containing protein [Bacillus sp. 165]